MYGLDMIFCGYFTNIEFIEFGSSEKRFITELYCKFVFLKKSQYLNCNNEISYTLSVVYSTDHPRLLSVSLQDLIPSHSGQ